MWSQNFATLQSTTAKSSGKTSKESLRSCKEYVKRFPFVPRDEFWGQRNGTQLSFPQLAGSRYYGQVERVTGTKPPCIFPMLPRVAFSLRVVFRLVLKGPRRLQHSRQADR